MNRRTFFKGLGLVAGGVALEQAIPFGRVWSFPAKPVIAKVGYNEALASLIFTSNLNVGDLISISHPKYEGQVFKVTGVRHNEHNLFYPHLDLVRHQVRLYNDSGVEISSESI